MLKNIVPQQKIRFFSVIGYWIIECLFLSLFILKNKNVTELYDNFSKADV